eukprot:479139-Pleurochrysis_carterae.AAC.1
MGCACVSVAWCAGGEGTFCSSARAGGAGWMRRIEPSRSLHFVILASSRPRVHIAAISQVARARSSAASQIRRNYY